MNEDILRISLARDGIIPSVDSRIPSFLEICALNDLADLGVDLTARRPWPEGATGVDPGTGQFLFAKQFPIVDPARDPIALRARLERKISRRDRRQRRLAELRLMRAVMLDTLREAVEGREKLRALHG
jgi:hypothetical protein